MAQIKGRIHSTESCGTVDGPGIRFVVFLQGCLMRCMYCHNRDTWDLHTGKEVTVDDIVNELLPYKSYMNASGGGITASGGEAVLQPEFVYELFKKCHAHGVNTCLDTNGYVRKHEPIIDQLIDETDVVMLDLKHLDDQVHETLVGVSNHRTLDFARYLQKRGQRTWIRHVVVPGYTDSEKSIRLLGEFIQGMDNIERVEMLPYHVLGEHKWKEMHEKYPLEGVEAPSKETMEKLKNILLEYHPKVIF